MQSLQELSLNVKELNLKVETLKSTEQSSKSDSQCGYELLNRLEAQERVVWHKEDGPALLLKPFSKFQREEDFVAALTPIINGVLSSQAPLAVFCNSERVQWIRTGSLPVYFRKPDGWVGFVGFYQHEGSRDDEGSTLFGKPAKWELRDGVSVVLEAKLSSMNDVVGQLQHDLQHICCDEPGQVERTGLAVLPEQFSVIDFLGPTVERVTQARWTDPGSRALFERALLRRNVWCLHADAILKEMELSIPSNGGCFLGLGAYGRVLKVKTKEGVDVSLKLILSRDKSHCDRAQREFNIAKSARGTEVVIDVFQCCSRVVEIDGIFSCGYTMEVGSEPDLKNLRALLLVLAKLHTSGWIHGDARVANLVVCRGALKWIDMTFAYQIHDAAFMEKAVESETLKFVKSCYARKHGIRSPDAKPTSSVMSAINNYAKAVSTRNTDACNKCLFGLEEAMAKWIGQREGSEESSL